MKGPQPVGHLLQCADRSLNHQSPWDVCILAAAICSSGPFAQVHWSVTRPSVLLEMRTHWLLPKAMRHPAGCADDCQAPAAASRQGCAEAVSNMGRRHTRVTQEAAQGGSGWRRGRTSRQLACTAAAPR